MAVNVNENIFFFFKGRVALYAILKAMGIKENDEVILPGFTCVAVPNAVIYHGAKPVYVDIDPETYNIDPKKIEEKITEKTRAIIAQHTFGIPADMDNILEIAKRYNLFVIEDSCHAIGSRYKGKEVGTLGDAAFFSSQWSKPVTTGLGGWAFINNEQLKKKMEKIYPEFIEPSYWEISLLRLQHFAFSKLFKPSLFWFMQNVYRQLSKTGLVIGSSSNEELKCVMPKKYNKRMSQWQRELIEKKIMEISRIIEHRRQITSLYGIFFRQKGIKTIMLPEDYDPVFLRYPLMVKDKRKILEDAKRKHVEIGDWFLSPIHPNLDEWEKVEYQKGICPNAEKICEHVINLPTHQGIGKREAEKIVVFTCNY